MSRIYSMWPTSKEEKQRLYELQLIKRLMATKNPNTIWLKGILKKTAYKWTSQARWGYRTFAFWCSVIGVVVEVDGPKDGEIITDEECLRSGIVVLRVKYHSIEDANKALAFIHKSELWWERRKRMGLKYTEPKLKLKERYDAYKLKTGENNPNWA